jgi:trehalose 6-phosphate phosphatase
MSHSSHIGGVPDTSSRGLEIGELPDALSNRDELAKQLSGKRAAVFLDYDGTLTPIVDRPQDAVIASGMRDVVRALSERCPVCVVTGRDRTVVQELMGIDDLIVAGSHGFDIWSPDRGGVEYQATSGFGPLLEQVQTRLREDLDAIEGALIEPKRHSVAVHYRLVREPDGHRVRQLVEALVAEHRHELKMTPGKMVYEIQPRVDWDKGKAVLYLLDTLGLEGDDVMPLYLGDDVTDEDAFAALVGRGIGIFVGNADDREMAGRRTAASYALRSTRDVQRFLDMLARGS